MARGRRVCPVTAMAGTEVTQHHKEALAHHEGAHRVAEPEAVQGIVGGGSWRAALGLVGTQEGGSTACPSPGVRSPGQAFPGSSSLPGLSMGLGVGQTLVHAPYQPTGGRDFQRPLPLRPLPSGQSPLNHIPALS